MWSQEADQLKSEKSKKLSVMTYNFVLSDLNNQV